ncbi:ComEA family DNA-binding protein [Moraxella nasovis]|uniref:ComEA family DNA-binding protein n=1 Tax=Moraxella nasovis TaxID=2904121 RepID=UPI001F60306C|nr:ComEA family DNA-binding protein [Moraxella nasovis]UNU72525.1 ComEA family DNA-binding protein [Moraxella nasovis]
MKSSKLLLCVLGLYTHVAYANQCYADPQIAYQAMMTHHTQTQKLANRININTATAADFLSLTGVGVKTAKAIVQYRQTVGNFQTIQDITQVKGVGQATFEKNKHRLTVLD